MAKMVRRRRRRNQNRPPSEFWGLSQKEPVIFPMGITHFPSAIVLIVNFWAISVVYANTAFIASVESSGDIVANLDTDEDSLRGISPATFDDLVIEARTPDPSFPVITKSERTESSADPATASSAIDIERIRAAAIARHTRARVDAFNQALPSLNHTAAARAVLFQRGAFPFTLDDGPGIQEHLTRLLVLHYYYYFFLLDSINT